MNKIRLSLSVACLLVALDQGSLAQSPTEEHPGSVLFRENCSSCHLSADAITATQIAPTLDSLQTLTAASLEFAINEGVMYGQASVLSNEQKALIVDYLAAEEDDRWLADTLCESDNRQVDLDQPVYLAGVGANISSTRNLSAAQAGLTSAGLGNLELAWALAFPNVSALRSAPVIVGSTVFFSATGTRKVMALDADRGCARWIFDSPTRLRSSLAYGSLGAGEPNAIVFGDGEGFVYALDALSGAQLWSADVRSHGRGVRLTGGMVLHEGRVLVPVSSSGVSQGGTPTFECCVGHGEIVALDAATGEVDWVYHTMPEADYTGERNSIGVPLRGPSGAPIWSTPTVDPQRNLVYVTTGENTSHPATVTSDAIIALDLDTGEPKWVFQGLWNDVWNTACGRVPGPNCPNQRPSTLADKDFGGSATLVKRAEGDILLAGQKTGDLWALNPDTGALIWNQRIGTGTTLGGNHWGIATDGEKVYLPINDPGQARGTYVPRPGIYSFFVETGEPGWFREERPACDNRSERLSSCDTRYGHSVLPLLIDGALVSGTVDGRLMIFDKDDGSLLFEFDTVQNYQTVNGVEGLGGAIDSHGISAGGGLLLVNSGYGRVGGTPGNVLLAFKPGASKAR
ncbi:MAG: PQQ-binding-like beta-propeller repeat protein [Gammaproteobacteria bacterium]